MAEYLDADLAVLTPYLEKLGATSHRAQLGTHDFSTTQGTGRLESTDVY